MRAEEEEGLLFGRRGCVLGHGPRQQAANHHLALILILIMILVILIIMFTTITMIMHYSGTADSAVRPRSERYEPGIQKARLERLALSMGSTGPGRRKKW